MGSYNFRDLLEAADAEYVAFLRSTPHPDEPHECREDPVCILCELVARHTAYEERLYWAAFSHEGTEGVKGWEFNVWLDSDERLIREPEHGAPMDAIKSIEESK